jgi:hypothetical protein
MQARTQSPEAKEIARRLLASVVGLRERTVSTELIDAARQLARHGAMSAAIAALRLAQLDGLRRSALRKLKLELRVVLKAPVKAR